MTGQDAIEALTLQHKRLTEVVRDIDGGLWWSSGAEAKLDADKIYEQAEIIRTALDETLALITRMTTDVPSGLEA